MRMVIPRKPNSDHEDNALLNASDHPVEKRNFLAKNNVMLAMEDEKHWKDNEKKKSIGKDIFTEMVAQSVAKTVVIAFRATDAERTRPLAFSATAWKAVFGKFGYQAIKKTLETHQGQEWMSRAAFRGSHDH